MSENNSEIIKQVTDIIKFVGENNLSELELETKTFNLKLKKYGEQTKPVVSQIIEQIPTNNCKLNSNKTNVQSSTTHEIKNNKELNSSKTVKAPMSGTYYSAPSPEASPFVKIGENINVGQTICIIEAMKMLNEIQSDKAGKIVEIKGKNGEPIEKGSPIIVIE